MASRTVTEADFRAPQFIGAKVEDYELRDDGAVVRKDRWEQALRNISLALDQPTRGGFEVVDVVEAVNEIVAKVERMKSLLAEVCSNFTRDDDLPNNLLERIDGEINE